jgi:hypothetical protein
MKSEDIQRLLKKAPFKPFALVMTNSERHAVDHPEMLIVTKSVLALAVMKAAVDPNAELPLADYVIWLDPEHVLKVEPLEAASSQSR